MPDSGGSRRLVVLCTVLAALAAVSLYLVLRPRPGASAGKGAAADASPRRAAARPTVEAIGWMRLDPGPAPGAIGDVAPPELPSFYRRRYLLKPDRRFLYGIEEIDRLTSGRMKPATLFVRFDGDRWSLRLEQDSVGSLPEIPTYADWEPLLASWATRCLAKRKISEGSTETPELSALRADLSQGTTTNTLAALGRVNALASPDPLRPVVLDAAAAGTVWLCAQVYDELQLSDALLGHAAALVALAKAVDPRRSRSDEALLLFVMGYSGAAADASAQLPMDDPVGPFVRMQPKRLAALVAATPNPRAQYLQLRAVGATGQAVRWWSLFKSSVWSRRVELASLRAVLALGQFETTPTAAQAFTLAAFLDATRDETKRTQGAELWGPEAWPDDPMTAYLSAGMPLAAPSPQALTRRFEESVSRRAAMADAPLFDNESRRSFDRACFYSGIHESARFLFDSLSSTPAGEEFAKGILDPAAGTAAQLKTWMLDRVRVRNGNGRNELISDLADFRAIGVVPLRRVIPFLSWTGDAGNDPSKRRMIRNVMAALDTRPADLEAALAFAESPLLDLPRKEKLLRVLAESEARGGDASIRNAWLQRDFALLRRLAADPDQRTATRLYALSSLRGRAGADPAFGKAQYEALMAAEPENLSALGGYVQWLETSNDQSGARAAAAGWLARRPTRDHDLTWVHVLALQAEAYANEKKWKDAFNTIQPALDSWSGEALDDGAWFLEESDRWDEALELATAARDRYPDSYVPYAIMARLFWREQKYAEAAELLAGSHALSRSIWEGDLARSFGHVFGKADPHLAQSAFSALQAHGIGALALAALAKDLGGRGNHKLAFTMLASLKGDRADSTAFAIWAHDELAKSDGEEAAAVWLRNTTAKDIHELAFVAFQFGRYDILWGPIEDPARPTKEDEIQLMRAASLIHAPDATGERHEKLVQYFQARPDNVWKPMGLFLLGKLSDEELFKAMKGRFDISSLGWMRGLRAADQGRYEEASDWFEIAVESDLNKQPPNAWAYGILSRWAGEYEPMAELQKKRKL